MKRAVKGLLTLCFLCVLLTLVPVSASANAAEPPSLIIVVNDPPEDLSIELLDASDKSEASFRRIGWEGYYIVYHNFRTDGIYTLRVNTGGKSFDCQTSQSLKHYYSVFTLNLKTQELTPGTSPLHAAMLISSRLVLTLLIEGFLFWLFGYRKRRSWLAFLFVNLATQSLLAVLLSLNGSTTAYMLYGLWLAEIPIFLIEMIALPLLITEHSKRRTVLFAFAANAVSLIAGSCIITILPV